MSTDLFEKKKFNAGEMIFREGDPGQDVYIVEMGRVRIWRGSNMNDNTLGFVEKKGIFGEMALINSNPRMASATADEETVCSIVPKDEFMKRYAEVNTFVRTMIKILACNINSLAEYVDKNQHI